MCEAEGVNFARVLGLLPGRSFRGTFPLGCTTLILLVTAAHLAVGLAVLAVYLFSGNATWVEQFFRVPGGLLLVALAGMQLAYSVLAWRGFDPGEPMRSAWGFISLAAACEMAGSLAVQILSADSIVNPLRGAAIWPDAAGWIRQAGLIAGGTCRFACLATGLFYALRVYRHAGFLARLLWPDRVILGVLAGYIVWEFADLGIAVRQGKHPGAAEMAGWPVDPLLWVLLLEAMLLYRSVRAMGPGWIGRCWMAFGAGVALVALGDVSLWATAYGYLRWPWNALGWYVWLPASAAFALAPAYQLHAMRMASAGGPVTR